MFPDEGGDDKRPIRAATTSVLSGNRSAADSTDPSRIGLITSGKGYRTDFLAKVNNLLPKIMSFSSSLGTAGIDRGG
jgi:hypothetical protein